MSHTNSSGGSLTRLTASPPSGSAPANRATARALAYIEHQTMIDMAQVWRTGMVEAEKLSEIDRLALHAVVGHAGLAKVAASVAQGDPFIADEVRAFVEVAQLAKANLLFAVGERFARGGR